ncbi:hypothetical protein CASFOL_029385 [Castilleja foliolosa]|uniref:Maturase K n=1 Tax=Castilleja foliolosa TaxID=1961234 RepID=A0ABD3CAJ0_9LAMI
MVEEVRENESNWSSVKLDVLHERCLEYEPQFYRVYEEHDRGPTSSCIPTFLESQYGLEKMLPLIYVPRFYRVYEEHDRGPTRSSNSKFLESLHGLDSILRLTKRHIDAILDKSVGVGDQQANLWLWFEPYLYETII